VRFYLDADLSPAIAAIARAQGADVTSAHELGQKELTDEQQLQFAGMDGRCIVTGNRDDFINLTIVFFEDGRPHAGLLIVPHSFPPSRLAAVARAIVEYDHAHPDGMPTYSYDYL
jgi:predicted nuclease of predicted toxin-antitoxin system